jgi:hypothetical protein
VKLNSGTQLKAAQWDTTESCTVGHNWKLNSGTQLKAAQWDTTESCTVGHNWKLYSGTQLKAVQWDTTEPYEFLYYLNNMIKYSLTQLKIVNEFHCSWSIFYRKYNRKISQCIRSTFSLRTLLKLK